MLCRDKADLIVNTLWCHYVLSSSVSLSLLIVQGRLRKTYLLQVRSLLPRRHPDSRMWNHPQLQAFPAILTVWCRKARRGSLDITDEFKRNLAVNFCVESSQPRFPYENYSSFYWYLLRFVRVNNVESSEGALGLIALVFDGEIVPIGENWFSRVDLFRHFRLFRNSRKNELHDLGSYHLGPIQNQVGFVIVKQKFKHMCALIEKW